MRTKDSRKRKYEQLVTGSGALESYLHQNLIEHLNAEIVLGTVNSVDVAVTWLQSTFLYVRAQSNPRHYGFPAELPNLLNKFSELCRHEVSLLDKAGLVVADEDGSLSATPLGALMARYCVSFRSMNTMLQVRGDESLKELLTLICECHEFSDVKLRTSDKRPLNELCKKKSGEERVSCIRFPVPGGKIKNRVNKIFCLVQAVFGCLPLNDPGLSQEANKIVRVGLRLAKCLREVVSLRGSLGYLEAQLNSALLSKCFACGLWENSRHVVRQLERVGPTLASALASARITSFTALETANPRDIEMVCSRQPPFGNKLQELAARLPRYALTLQQVGKVLPDRCSLEIGISLSNASAMRNSTDSAGSNRPNFRNHSCLLIIGDQSNNTLFFQRITDTSLLHAGRVTRRVEVRRVADGDELSINFISETWAGLDIQNDFRPLYATGTAASLPPPQEQAAATKAGIQALGVPEQPGDAEARRWREQRGSGTRTAEVQRRSCLHQCADKLACAHNCCKVGVRQTYKTHGSSDNQVVSNAKRMGAALTQNLPAKRYKQLTPRKAAVPPTCQRLNASETPTLADFGFINSKRKMQRPAALETRVNDQLAETMAESDVNNNCIASKDELIGVKNDVSPHVEAEERHSEIVDKLENPQICDISWDECIEVNASTQNKTSISIESSKAICESNNNENDILLVRFRGAEECNITGNKLSNSLHTPETVIQNCGTGPCITQLPTTSHAFEESSSVSFYKHEASSTDDCSNQLKKIQKKQENEVTSFKISHEDQQCQEYAVDTSTEKFLKHLAGFKTFSQYKKTFNPDIANNSVTNSGVVEEHKPLSQPSNTVTGHLNEELPVDSRLSTILDQLRQQWPIVESSEDVIANMLSQEIQETNSNKVKTRAVASVLPEPRAASLPAKKPLDQATVDRKNTGPKRNDLEVFQQEREKEQSIFTNLYQKKATSEQKPFQAELTQSHGNSHKLIFNWEDCNSQRAHIRNPVLFKQIKNFKSSSDIPHAIEIKNTSIEAMMNAECIMNDAEFLKDFSGENAENIDQQRVNVRTSLEFDKRDEFSPLKVQYNEERRPTAEQACLIPATPLVESCRNSNTSETFEDFPTTKIVQGYNLERVNAPFSAQADRAVPRLLKSFEGHQEVTNMNSPHFTPVVQTMFTATNTTGANVLDQNIAQRIMVGEPSNFQPYSQQGLIHYQNLHNIQPRFQQTWWPETQFIVAQSSTNPFQRGQIIQLQRPMTPGVMHLTPAPTTLANAMTSSTYGHESLV